MAIIEIEDQHIEQLRQLQAQGVPLADRTADYKRAKDHEAFITNVGNNPKHRNKLLELLDESGTYVPEIARVREAEDKFTNLLNERMKPLDEFLAGEKEKRENEKTRSVENLIENGRSFLRKEGWDDAGITKVETFMRDHSVGSYDVASKYMRAQEPDPTPLPTTPWGGRAFGTEWFNAQDDAPDHKLLLENPQAFTNQEINKFFREKREGRLQLP